MSLSPSELREILAILEASGWEEAQLTVGDMTLSVSKGGARLPNASVAPRGTQPQPAAPTSGSRPPMKAVDVDPGPHASNAVGYDITSPTVGQFWAGPEPGAPPFVLIGDRVVAGDTLCIVEVMKLMNYVRADRGGVVVAIYPQNGDHVEFGTRLLTLDPDPE